MSISIISPAALEECVLAWRLWLAHGILDLIQCGTHFVHPVGQDIVLWCDLHSVHVHSKVTMVELSIRSFRCFSVQLRSDGIEIEYGGKDVRAKLENPKERKSSHRRTLSRGIGGWRQPTTDVQDPSLKKYGR